MATPSQAGGTAVVGYFANGDGAHRAINALIDEGFRPSEIGAAFHTGSAMSTETGAKEGREQTRRANVGGELRDELGTTLPEHTTSERTRTGTSSAASDTLAVQYASLGGGAGTPYDMPPRPGPISGGDVNHSGLPSELKSSLPHDSDLRGGEGQSREDEGARRNWGERLRPVFGAEQGRENEGDAQRREDREDEKRDKSDRNKAGDNMESVIRKDEQTFGTGEGSLNLNTPPPQRYSQPAFEQSFAGYGVQPEHARHLSHRIGRGGAVVTVHATARAEVAERILQAHSGEVRMDTQPLDNALEGAAQDGEVEVFGTVGRDYPGYLK